jgi:Xaa-Pro aminopeptidase
VVNLKRIEALKQLAFEKKGFDGFLVTNGANQLYFAGFPGTACILIPKKGKNTIYVYGVNYEQTKAEAKGFNVDLVKRGENLADKIAKKVKTSKIKKLGLDTITGIPSVADYRKLRKAMRGIARIRIDNKPVSELRKVKDTEEIELMRKAGELTSQGMKAAYETIKSDVKEYEVAAEIEYTMRKKGSCGTAFETIVVSGIRSAFPHGGCTDRKIRKGDLVVVDIGATYQYYCSDMTRTIAAGKPSKKQKKIYEIVRQAQEKSFQAVKPKAKTKEIDAISRKTIEDAGYGEHYVHGLGHGVGLEIHELPTLNPESKDRLRVGNVVTVEPGVYIVGFGGIRIEDTVLVRKRKAEKLTRGPYILETKR